MELLLMEMYFNYKLSVGGQIESRICKTIDCPAVITRQSKSLPKNEHLVGLAAYLELTHNSSSLS